MQRFLIVFLTALGLGLPIGLAAQTPTLNEAGPGEPPPLMDTQSGAVPPAPVDTEAQPRAATGGAQTLQDILRRQKGLAVDPAFRKDAIGNADAAQPPTAPLGTLGGASDPELWRALRYGEATITTQSRSPGATLAVQDSGMAWLKFRAGPLREWGGWYLGAVIVFLALFYLIRGRVRLSHGPAGVTITRFSGVERFAHWLTAGSFVLLGLTGLLSLYARLVIPRPEGGFSTEASIAARQNAPGLENLVHYGKLIHDNVAWAFMAGLVLIFVMWVIHNLPDRTDLVWLAKGGGIVGKAHPPAKKFNAGQKLVFWAVVILGTSIAASGLSLLFPFDLPLFAKTFHGLNALGAPGWFGQPPLPEALTPHAEMQLAQVWHAMVAIAMIGVILAHIYIGTLGMEGAFDAMGTGEVDLNWAKDHHSLWVEEVEAKKSDAPETAAPAE